MLERAANVSSQLATYLVLIRRSHVLDNLLRLGLRDATLLGNNLREDGVHLAGHVCRITADVEVRLLFEHLVDLLGSLPQTVLYIHLLRPFPRECGYKLELVSESLLVFLFDH